MKSTLTPTTTGEVPSLALSMRVVILVHSWRLVMTSAKEGGTRELDAASAFEEAGRSKVTSDLVSIFWLTEADSGCVECAFWLLSSGFTLFS